MSTNANAVLLDILLQNGRKVGEVGMIQIDIPTPKNCGVCPICNEYLMCGVPCNGRGWGENDVSDYFSNGRPEWCPLKEQEALAVREDKVNKCVCGNEINRYWHPEYCGFCGKKLIWY